MKRILALLALGACTQMPPALPAAENDTCAASEYGYLIGQDATTLETVLLLGKVRVIRPGQPVTMDFWPDRINFMIGEDEQIVSINCG